MLKGLSLIVLAFGSTCGDASATEFDSTVAMLTQMAGTLNVTASPYMADGKLAGCTFVFDALHQDWKYRAGGFIKVSGSFGVMKTGETYGAMQKVVVNAMDFSRLPVTMEPSPPSRIYLRNDEYQSNLQSLVGASPSDTPGANFSVFQVSPSLDLIVEALGTSHITVGFNQFGGSSDVEVSVDLEVTAVAQDGKRTRSPDAIAQFGKCLAALDS